MDMELPWEWKGMGWDGTRRQARLAGKHSVVPPGFFFFFVFFDYFCDGLGSIPWTEFPHICAGALSRHLGYRVGYFVGVESGLSVSHRPAKSATLTYYFRAGKEKEGFEMMYVYLFY